MARMTALQGGDVVTSQQWTGIARRPWYRRPERLAAVVLLAALALGTVTWWLVVHGVPELQVRVDSAKLRSVELPPGFEQAPWACAGATSLCAWTELPPEEAARELSAALADAGVTLPEASCGSGIKIPMLDAEDPQYSRAPGVCSASSPRHGLTLGLVARNQVPVGELDGAPVDYPRTLVTVAWYGLEGSVPEVWLAPEEIAALPGRAAGAPCDASCMSLGVPILADEFPEVVAELVDAGVVVDNVRCEDEHCWASGRSARPGYPGASLLYLVNTATERGPELSVVPWY